MKNEMRLGMTILFLTNCVFNVVAQVAVIGILIDVKSGRTINFGSQSYQFYLSGNGKIISITIDSAGRYKINGYDLEGLGKTVDLVIGGIGTDYRLAEYEMANIPADNISVFLSKVYVSNAFLIPSCGSDCFTVDNKKTYRQKQFTINNGRVKYKMNRVPKDGIKNEIGFKVKYLTDCAKDILE
jgi:hypothetical protein